VPDAVLSGHVHDCQRYSRDLGGVSVPYIVSGNGGYANTQRSLHKLQKGLETQQLPYSTKRAGVALEYYDTANAGFLRLTATADQLLIEYFSVSFDDPPVVSPSAADRVTVSAAGAPKSP
jgi:hypothetical protein